MKGSAMKIVSHSVLSRAKRIATRAGSILLGLMLAAGTATTVLAQGEIANGTVSGSGSGPYTYDLTFGAAANSLSPVGSIWYAWTPGLFYLPGDPIAGTAHAPTGWTANIFLNSIQFSANSSANDIPIGGTLSGFSYQANFTPAQLAAAPNSGLSVAYAGGIETDAGYTFTVQTVSVPEPSALSLLVAGLAAAFLAGWRRLRLV
jgi:PEP-CTERM motif